MSALTEALCAAQAELPTAIPRDSQGCGYRYTSLDKLIELTRPILNANGLTITQWPSWIPRGEEAAMPTLSTSIVHTSGEKVENVMPLYLTDKTMQGLGAAITCARCLDTPADPRCPEDEYEPLEDVVPHDLERLPRA